jgi:hypothetical protein
MPLYRQRQLIRRNAAAIIAYPNRLQPATIDIDFDATRSRVQRILQQLFDDRCRPLNDFTGSDLVDQIGR